MGDDWRAWGGVVVLAALVCFTGFLCPLQEPQESRYAEIPRQMLTHDSFVVPVLHGQPYYDKPPLFYWLVMASYAVFGVTETAARLVPCMAAFLTVLVVHGWARRQIGLRAAFFGTAILCLSPRFIQLDRMLTMDSLLCLWVVSAWAFGQRALTGQVVHRGWWLAAAVACGLGVLTKGPVALVLVLPPLLALRWIDPDKARPGVRAVAGFLFVSVGLAAPWFVAVALRDGTFLAYFFWLHHVQRYVDPFDHVAPWWFYLPELLVGMLPWTLLLPAFVVAAWRRVLPIQPAVLFVLLLTLWCLAFFSLAGCKRPFYILPAMPPLALALGGCLDGTLAARPMPRFGWLAGGATTLLMLIGVGLMLPGYAAKFSLGAQVSRHAALGRDGQVAVYCYPRRWDSVSFYLQRDDVRVFRAEERAALLEELERHPGALVFARLALAGDLSAMDIQKWLPEGMAWEALGKPGRLAVGRVIPRPATVAAHSQSAP
ncbi:hypothetical protein AYO44_03230 [Planctomycetaceae bacterium SCGC AG-212-F19]|nr:hypothetical protein AYO44_03230 [Planctomycetaceae bacterium SCGC AG-212-F19]